MDTSNPLSYIILFTLISIPMGFVMGFVQIFMLPLNQWISRKIWAWLFRKFGDTPGPAKVETEKLIK